MVMSALPARFAPSFAGASRQRLSGAPTCKWATNMTQQAAAELANLSNPQQQRSGRTTRRSASGGGSQGDAIPMPARKPPRPPGAYRYQPNIVAGLKSSTRGKPQPRSTQRQEETRLRAPLLPEARCTRLGRKRTEIASCWLLTRLTCCA